MDAIGTGNWPSLVLPCRLFSWIRYWIELYMEYSSSIWIQSQSKDSGFKFWRRWAQLLHRSTRFVSRFVYLRETFKYMSKNSVVNLCFSLERKWKPFTLVDPGGGTRDTAPSLQFLSFSCSAWQTFCRITGKCPCSEVGALPSEESWSRHCLKFINNLLESETIEDQIGFFCSPFYDVILSSGKTMIIVMTTNNDTRVGRGFLATVTAGNKF